MAKKVQPTKSLLSQAENETQTSRNGRKVFIELIRDVDSELASDIEVVTDNMIAGKYRGKRHGSAPGLYKWLCERTSISSFVSESGFVSWARLRRVANVKTDSP